MRRHLLRTASAAIVLVVAWQVLVSVFAIPVFILPGPALVAHTVEVWVFALVYYLLVKDGSFGGMEGHFSGSLLDCVYFSYAPYNAGPGNIGRMPALARRQGLDPGPGGALPPTVDAPINPVPRI